jgi:hypothetical protein
MLGKSGENSDLGHAKTAVLGSLKAYATPLEQQRALICGYLSTSVPKSLKMSYSKSLASKFYLDL